MKVLVISDSHGEEYDMFEAIDREEPVDMVIHCGDIVKGYDRLRDKVNCTLHVVAGNMDYDPDMDRIKEIDICGHSAIVTHGHRYQLHGDASALYYLAAENQAELVFFGHTHVPVIKEEGSVMLINPGSISLPRQHGRKRSYAVGTVEAGKKPSFEIKYLD